MKRLYIIVRTDLKRSSPAVQAGHAVAQFMLDHKNEDWDNDYLLYLKVNNLNDLNSIKTKVELNKSAKISKFYEPDINNELTAIAVYKHFDNFANLRLL